MAPTTVDRGSAGDVVGFNFPTTNPLSPGDCSDVLLIETNATAYTTGTLSIDGGIAEIASCAPSPEPASAFLFGTGLLALGGILRRRLASRA